MIRSFSLLKKWMPILIAALVAIVLFAIVLMSAFLSSSYQYGSGDYSPDFTLDMLSSTYVSDYARQDIPPELLEIFMDIQKQYRVPWSVLAAISKYETDHGRKCSNASYIINGNIVISCVKSVSNIEGGYRIGIFGLTPEWWAGPKYRARHLDLSAVQKGNVSVSDNIIKKLKSGAWVTFNATAYTAWCERCSGTTATGIKVDIPNSNFHIIAVDPDIIPLNSTVELIAPKGRSGIYLAADTGSDIKDLRIDILTNGSSPEDAEQKAKYFGYEPVQLRVLSWGKQKVRPIVDDVDADSGWGISVNDDIANPSDPHDAAVSVANFLLQHDFHKKPREALKALGGSFAYADAIMSIAEMYSPLSDSTVITPDMLSGITIENGIAWPVPQSYRITSGFGARPDPFNPGRMQPGGHKGIDIGPAGGADTAIVSMGKGTVVYAGWGSPGTGVNNYGEVVVIKHADSNVYSLYGHMKRGSIQVREGQSVQPGTPLGIMGSTGQSTGIHLHLGLWVGWPHQSGSVAVNPVCAFKIAKQGGALPWPQEMMKQNPYSLINCR